MLPSFIYNQSHQPLLDLDKSNKGPSALTKGKPVKVAWEFIKPYKNYLFSTTTFNFEYDSYISTTDSHTYCYKIWSHFVCDTILLFLLNFLLLDKNWLHAFKFYFSFSPIIKVTYRPFFYAWRLNNNLLIDIGTIPTKVLFPLITLFNKTNLLEKYIQVIYMYIYIW